MTTHTKTGRGGVWRQPERRLDPAAGDDMVVMVAEAAMVVMVAVAVGVAGQRVMEDGRRWTTCWEGITVVGGTPQPTGTKATHRHKGRRC